MRNDLRAMTNAVQGSTEPAQEPTCASVNLRFSFRLGGTCIAMRVPTQNARLGYHLQYIVFPFKVKVIVVLAAAYHALASAAADRASHWAAMPNHQPSCFARSKLPCVAQAYYSVSNQLRLDAVYISASLEDKDH